MLGARVGGRSLGPARSHLGRLIVATAAAAVVVVVVVKLVEPHRWDLIGWPTSGASRDSSFGHWPCRLCFAPDDKQTERLEPVGQPIDWIEWGWRGRRDKCAGQIRSAPASPQADRNLPVECIGSLNIDDGGVAIVGNI